MNSDNRLIPMIDVILLVSSLFLILLCLLSPTFNKGVSAIEFRNESAKDGKSESSFSEKFLHIYVRDDGKIMCDKLLIAREQLKEKLQKSSPLGTTVISGEKTLVRDLYPVLEIVNEARISRIEFKLKGGD